MKIYKTFRKIEMTAGVAIGCFDGVHVGHAAVINAATQYAALHKVVPAVVTFSLDEARPESKGGRDLETMDARRAELRKLGVEVCCEIPLSRVAEMTGREFVCRCLGTQGVNASAVFVGEDFRFAAKRSCGVKELREYCAELGIEAVIVPKVVLDGEPVSTTRIKKAVENADMALAAKLLGREYALTAEVETGRKLAGKLGFPTVNQRFPDVVRPRFGVYASRVRISGREYRAITNLGVRPTYFRAGEVTAETHVFGYEGDLYGKRLTVRLAEFIRDERAFSSDAELAAAVEADMVKARTL